MMASHILFVLFFFLLVAQTPFCESALSFWKYAPSPGINIADEDFSKVTYRFDDEVNWKYLAKAGLPLAHHLSDEEVSRYLIDLLALKKNICPIRELNRGGLLFGFYPEELERRFGWERITLLRKSALHPFWAIAAQSDRADKRKSTADEMIAKADSIFGIGVMRLILPHHFRIAGFMPNEVAFHDLRAFSIFVGKEQQLVVDPGVLKKRKDLQTRLFTRIAFNYVYTKLNNKLHEVRDEAFKEVNTIIEREHQRYNDELSFVRDYQEYIRTHPKKKLLSKGPVEIAPLPPRLDKKEAEAEEQEKHNFKCFQIRAALKTLEEEGIRSQGESRHTRLLELAHDHHCVLTPPERTARDGETALPPEACEAFRHGVAVLSQQYAYTKRLPTVAQSLSLLVHTFSKATDIFSHLDGIDLNAFFLWANRFVSNGEMTTCAREMEVPLILPRAFQGQLRYTASMMHLLAAKATHEETETEEETMQRHSGAEDAHGDARRSSSRRIFCPWVRTGCKVRALVGLQQAMWEGSPNAAATLSAFRNTGFVLRRQTTISSFLSARSLEHASFFLFRELLNGADADAIVPADRLIRFVRPFYSLHSWNVANGLHLGNAYVSYIFALSDISSEEEDGGSSANPYEEDFNGLGEGTWGISMRIATKERQGYLLMMGTASSPTRMETAECHFLLVLRELGYTCDAREMNAYPQWAATLARQHAAACHSQAAVLASLESDPSEQHVLCEYDASRPLHGGATTSHFYTPPRRAHFDLLQKALVDLGYFYLLNGQQYDLVALYAHLSMKLSIHSLQVGLRLRRCGALAEVHRVVPSKACRTSCESNWACKQILTRIPWSVTNVSAAVPPLLHTNFFRQEAFTLLAVSSLLGKDQDQSDASPIGYIVHKTFKEILGAATIEEEKQTVSASDKAFLLLFAAAQLAPSQDGIILDGGADEKGVRDPFALLTLLLTRRKKGGNEDFVYAFEHLHALYHRHAYTWKLDRLLVPLASDTRRSYLRRLLRRQREKYESYDVQLEALQHGFNKKLFVKRSPSRHVLHPLAEDTTYVYSMYSGKQYTAEKEDMRPLLYFSDLQDHYNATKQTTIGRWGSALYDGLLYLFTETTEEKYVRLAASEVMPATLPYTYYQDMDDVPPFVSMLPELFQRDAHFQPFVVALLLATKAFEIGALQGYSLIFHEVLDRQNQFLHVLAGALMRDIWPMHYIASVWFDHHLAAQWNLMKPKTNGYSGVLSLRTTTQYDTLSKDILQEWISLLFRLHAATLFHASKTKGSSSYQAQAAQWNRTGEELLSLCTGLLYYTYMYKNTSLVVTDGVRRQHPVETFFYDGMSLPAGNTQCAVDLYTHWKQTGRRSSDVLHLLRTLQELNHRRALYYWHPHKSPEEEERERRKLRTWRRFHHVDDTADRRKNAKPYYPVESEKLSEKDRRGATVKDVEMGEGVYYFRRLQTITGVKWATCILMIWEKVTYYFQ